MTGGKSKRRIRGKKENKLEKNEKYDEIYVMMYTLQTLHNKGISIKKTVYESVANLIDWYEQFENREYLELALLHIQAYVNMGFALDDAEPVVKKILQLTGKTKEDFFPRENRCRFGKKIKLNRSSVRGMIGKWKATRENPKTVAELVDEIIEKVKTHEEGRYIYQYQRKNTEDMEIYELVIQKEECYFYDVKNFRFYTFSEE